MHFSIYYYSTVFAVSAYAYTPAPVALRPGSWLGTDGNWSTVAFQLGSNSQAVDVLVSTTLSEFWAVGAGGCHDKMLHCSAARGGVYTPRASKTWTSLGTWQLGLEYLGYGGNGEYGQDSALLMHTLGTDDTLSMSGVLIAAINTTDYLNGLFGLGITQGNFGGKVAMSPLTEAVQKAGWIPSYSYGYTAGASYRNSPVSLTLGGYQEARFVNHGISFTLGSADNLPRSLVRGIEVSVQDGTSEPEGWNSSTEILSTWDNSFEALIDTTTPYLWLPDVLCDKLEAAFNLTYNNTFELYTLTNDQYREFMKEDSISFTFSLSSFDNTDDFGQPLDAYGVVNITIPARAFTGTLQYPFMNAAIAYGDPAVPFFALRRASNTSTMIIGRSFLQESYIITKYDEAVFSIHQALFPNSSASDLVLTPIWQPGNNVYPGPPSRGGSGLSTAEKAGIAVGVIVGCLIAGIIGWLFYRRQRNKKNAGSETRSKGGENSDSPTVRGSLVSRIFSILGRRKKSPKEGAVLEKVAEQPCEAPNTQIYELPAPIPPAELDGDDASSLNGDTLGAESTQSMSAYEVARRKMDRQRQGPAPAYTPPSDGGLIPAEKTDHVTTTLAIPPRLRTHPPSPPSSLSATDTGTANTNSLQPSLPSPITPRLDWTNRMGEPPSPLTSTNVGSSTHLSGPSLRPMSARSEAGSMTSSHISPTTDRFVEPSNLPLSVPMGQATVQRTPIEPSRVVLLGPLPDNVRLSRRNSESRHADAHVEAGPPDAEVHRGHRTYDSLGSNFTVDEELRLDLTRQMDQSPAKSTNQQSNTRLSQVQTQGLGTQRSSPINGTEPSSPDSQGRINPGLDLVHVPQLAERRYSWEEER